MKARKIGLLAMVCAEFDDDDDDDMLALLATQQNFESRASVCLKRKDIERHFRLGHLTNNLDWIQQYLDCDFHHRFRMKKDTFWALVEVVRPSYPVKLTRGDAPVVDCSKAVLITLCYLGHEDSMDDVGDRFGVALSTVHTEVHRVVNILCSLRKKFIVWPKANECAIIEEQFRMRVAKSGGPGFPGVLGAIDGCHVEILAPADDQVSYTDRKMNHSIILQGICSATKVFTNVSIGTPGSRNDNRALSFSSVYRNLMANGHRGLLYEDRYHLIGDKAYPNRSWMMSPYKNYGNLTRKQRRYNYKHSVTRVVIEHTFGLLKGRWRRLLCLVLKDVAKDTNFILAACILHNFCYLHNDAVIQDMIEEIRMVGGGQQAVVADAISKQIGDQKREEICDIF